MEEKKLPLFQVKGVCVVRLTDHILSTVLQSFQEQDFRLMFQRTWKEEPIFHFISVNRTPLEEAHFSVVQTFMVTNKM